MPVKTFLRVGAWYQSESGKALSEDIEITSIVSNADPLDPVVAVSDSDVGYDVYTALLSQTGTDAPVATVLGNTLGGTVALGRTDVGQYTATLSGVFTANKTVVFALLDGAASGFVVTAGRFSDNVVNISTYDETFTPLDLGGILSIEIRVYD